MSYLNRSGPKERHGRYRLTMRILITGGFGFIGGRLAQYLHYAGHQIVIGSRKAGYNPVWLPQAEVVLTDWNDYSSFEQICSKVDVVIHAAGLNAQECFLDPVRALEVNCMTTARLVSAANLVGVSQFIYLSTAHIYANPLAGIITEDTCPRNLHSYATSHLAGENIVLSANMHSLIKGIVIRLSNAFGTPVHSNVNCWMLLINDLCRQAVETRKLVLRSNGLQKRDFITLHDTVRCVEHLITLPKIKCGNGLFNLGGENTQSIHEITTLVAARCEMILGFTPIIERVEANNDNQVLSLEYNIAKLKRIGFSLQNQINYEIDSLLNFCNKEFGKIDVY